MLSWFSQTTVWIGRSGNGVKIAPPRGWADAALTERHYRCPVWPPAAPVYPAINPAATSGSVRAGLPPRHAAACQTGGNKDASL